MTATPTVSYSHIVPGLAISGFGMALFFAPVANLVLSSVQHEEQGIASGAHNAIRELGGVFGVAVLASVFAHYGRLPKRRRRSRTASCRRSSSVR